jgi:CheY-like chemotaxis protein
VTVQILLVGREQAFRDRLRLSLERLEATGETVEFLEAADGNAALELADAERPDLVVVEVGVTPYGGFGLTRDILGRPQDEWLGRWSGADALVDRPVDPFALATVARRLLEERQAARQDGTKAATS